MANVIVLLIFVEVGHFIDQLGFISPILRFLLDSVTKSGD